MVTINDIFQFGALVGKVEVDLLNKDDDNYRRQVLHSENVNNIWTSWTIWTTWSTWTAWILDNMDTMNNMATLVNMDSMDHC